MIFQEMELGGYTELHGGPYKGKSIGTYGCCDLIWKKEPLQL